MLRGIFGGPADQTTPKAGSSNQTNPFDLLVGKSKSPSSSRKNSVASVGVPSGARTPTSQRFAELEPHPGSPGANARTPGPIAANANFTHAPATTSVSVGEPNFSFTVNPAELARQKGGSARMSPPKPSNGSAAHASLPPTPSKEASNPIANLRGTLTINLISARNLAAPSKSARPYVVATFDQSEFVSREPIAETAEPAKGIAAHKPRLMAGTSPTAAARTISRPTTPNRSQSSSGLARSLDAAAEKSATDPVWKHEVVLCARLPRSGYLAY
jgi:protein-serine/threonine kinase